MNLPIGQRLAELQRLTVPQLRTRSPKSSASTGPPTTAPGSPVVTLLELGSPCRARDSGAGGTRTRGYGE